MAPFARQSSQSHSYALIDPMIELLDKSEINIEVEKQEDPHWIDIPMSRSYSIEMIEIPMSMSSSIEMNTIDIPLENEGKREMEQNMSNSKKLKMQENAFSTENYLANEKEEYKVQTDLQNLLLKFRIIEKLAKMKLRSLLETENVSSKQNIAELQLLCEYYENVVCKFDLFVAKYSLHLYPEEEDDFQDIVTCVNEIIRMYDSVPSLVTFLKTKVHQKKENVWCSFLGLSDEVADYLLGLGEIQREHQSTENWIYSYLEKQYETLPAELSLKDGLKHLGFTDCRATFLAGCLTQSSVSDHQAILHWASSYIQQYFDHHILFSGRPYLPRREEDQPFKIQTVPCPEEEDTEQEPVNVQVLPIKLDGERLPEGNKWISEYLSQDTASMEETEYWFHGTNQEAARNIVEHGIMLGKAKAFMGADFSYGNSFYITNNFDFAFDWSKHFNRCRPDAAVVVFKLKDKTIFSERKGKTFAGYGKEWTETVSYFRNKANHIDAKISRSKGIKLKEFKYFYGPCSNDGDKVKFENFKPGARMTKEHRAGRESVSKYVYQLCLKDDCLAEDFYNRGLNIHQILFF